MNLELQSHLEPSLSTAETDWQNLLFQHTDAVCPPGSCSYAPAVHPALAQALPLCILKSGLPGRLWLLTFSSLWTHTARAQGMVSSGPIASSLLPNIPWIFCTGPSLGTSSSNSVMTNWLNKRSIEYFCSYCAGHLKELKLTFREEQMHLSTSLFFG